MPNIKSAAKRMRQNAKHRQANRAKRAAFRTAIKKTRSQIAETTASAEMTEQLSRTFSVIGKAARKGLIHKNKAARLASRLSRQANARNAQKPSA